MKKLNFFFKTFLTVSILCNSASTQSMEVDSYSSTSKYNEEYNNTNCLLFTMIHPEILTEIFSHCVIENDLSVVALPCPPTVSAEVLTQEEALATAGAKSEDEVKLLKDSIRTWMKLSFVCKKFNGLLTYEKIGDLCKGYTQEDKDKTIRELMNSMINSYTSYSVIRLPLFILLHAGAKNYHYEWEKNWLIQRVIRENDIQLVKALFKYKVDIEQAPQERPLWHMGRTTEMAQLLINHKDILCKQESSRDNDDILFCIIFDEYSSDLIPFHIQNGADLAHDRSNGYCLLHQLALLSGNVKNHENFFKKAEFLLNAIPEKINSLHIATVFDREKEKTPLDIAEDHLCYYHKQNDPIILKLIALFKKHGALTASQLKDRMFDNCTIS